MWLGAQLSIRHPCIALTQNYTFVTLQIHGLQLYSGTSICAQQLVSEI